MENRPSSVGPWLLKIKGEVFPWCVQIDSLEGKLIGWLPQDTMTYEIEAIENMEWFDGWIGAVPIPVSCTKCRFYEYPNNGPCDRCCHFYHDEYEEVNNE